MNGDSVVGIVALVEQSASTAAMAVNDITLASAKQQFLFDMSGYYSAPSGITNAFQQLSHATLQAIGAQAVLDAGLVNQPHVEFLYESQSYPSGFASLPSTGGRSSTRGSSSDSYYVPQANLS